MPSVRIDLWKGRDKQKKKELIKKVPSAVVDAIDCSTEAVHVIINKVDMNNWEIGGVSASVKFPDVGQGGNGFAVGR